MIAAESDSDDDCVVVLRDVMPCIAAEAKGDEEEGPWDVVGEVQLVLEEAAAAACSQCAGTGTNTHSCAECGLLCQQCGDAHMVMRCFRQHDLVALKSSEDSTSVKFGDDCSRPAPVPRVAAANSPAKDEARAERRDRAWHWRWSESMPEPHPRPAVPNEQPQTPKVEMAASSAVGSWSIGGGDSTCLHRPRSVAVGTDGLLYVCDMQSDSKVKVFSAADGSFVRFLGADFGTGEGSLDCPTAVAVDAWHVYVSDATSNRIQGADEPVALFPEALPRSETATALGVLACLHPEAEHAHAHFYACAPVYSAADGAFVKTLSADMVGVQGSTMRQPVGLALDGRGNLLVADSCSVHSLALSLLPP